MDKLITKWLQESDRNTQSSLKSDSAYDIAFFGGYALAKKECVNELRRHLTNQSSRGDNIAANLTEMFRKGGTVQDMMNYLNTRR